MEGKDHGLAWLAVAGAVVTNVMYAAMTRAFGVLYVILLERYEGSELMTSWVGALNLITVGFAGKGWNTTGTPFISMGWL